MNNLSFTVKMLRKQYNLTQEELSLKSGVGLRFVRDVSMLPTCWLSMEQPACLGKRQKRYCWH